MDERSVVLCTRGRETDGIVKARKTIGEHDTWRDIFAGIVLLLHYGFPTVSFVGRKCDKLRVYCGVGRREEGRLEVIDRDFW
jgi:hypothetical protein